MTKLLILWLLAEMPMHGYRIRKILRAPELAFWFRLEDASIYSMLRSLVRQGLARPDGDEAGENHKTRSLYAITPAGRQALTEGLRAAWLDTAPRADLPSIALATLDEFEADEISDLLRARRAALESQLEDLSRLARAAPSQLLARREAALLTAEVTWLAAEIKSSS